MPSGTVLRRWAAATCTTRPLPITPVSWLCLWWLPWSRWRYPRGFQWPERVRYQVVERMREHGTFCHGVAEFGTLYRDSWAVLVCLHGARWLLVGHFFRYNLIRTMFNGGRYALRCCMLVVSSQGVLAFCSCNIDVGIEAENVPSPSSTSLFAFVLLLRFVPACSV